MAEPRLEGLLSWARYVDKGIRHLVKVVERNGICDSGVDPAEVLDKFENIIDDVKTMKASVQNDVDLLKSMSDMSKEMIELTESDEMNSISDELNVMLNTFFREEVGDIVELSVPDTEVEPAVQNMVEDSGSQVPVAGAAALSLNCSPNSYPEESFTEVEITPGLINKIPRSRLESSTLVVPPEHYSHPAGRPIRKKTLIFSPSEMRRTSRSPTVPTIDLQDYTNRSPSRDEAKPKSPDCSEGNSDDSPEILERPTRPVLSSELYKLLR